MSNSATKWLTGGVDYKLVVKCIMNVSMRQQYLLSQSVHCDILYIDLRIMWGGLCSEAGSRPAVLWVTLCCVHMLFDLCTIIIIIIRGISAMELGHLLTRSGLTYPEVSSKLCHDSFCQLGNSVSLPGVIY